MRKVFILALLVLTLSAFLTACGGGGSGGGGSYTLSISPMPTNGTVVSATAVGINCGSGGSACSASFSDTVVLIATPDAGYTFAGWGGDCSSCGTMPICSINMNANKTCSANFTPSSGGSYTLSINPTPTNGTVTSSPAGINCGSGGSACSASFTSGSTVTLTATPDAGYTFAGWTGDCSSCSTSTCTINMNANKTCSANFTPSSGGSYTLSINPTPTNGTVTSSPAGINCGSGGSACSASFTSGSTVTLTATSDAGYTFAGWGGDCSSCGTMPICSINMNANKTCSANFTTTPTYTDARVHQVSNDGSVLVGRASVSGNTKPMVWRINAGSLSPGFYWLADIATQTNVLNTGLSSYPYGAVLGVTADGTVGCGYGSSRTDASTGDRALAWNLTTLQPIHLPDHSSGGNVAYACAKSGGDVYIVGRVYPNFPTPTIWKNYTIWHQNTSVAYGIFHDITPDASKASAQLVYQGWVYYLNSNQYTQLVSSIDGAYWSRISPDGQAVAFSDSNSISIARIKVWYGGNVYTVNMSIDVGAVRVRSGVAYVFGSNGSNAVRWRSDTTTMENLNTVFASVLPSGVTLKSISAVSLDNRVMVGVAYNPTTNRDEVFVLVGDPFQGTSP